MTFNGQENEFSEGNFMYLTNISYKGITTSDSPGLYFLLDRLKSYHCTFLILKKITLSRQLHAVVLSSIRANIMKIWENFEKRSFFTEKFMKNPVFLK